MTRDDLIDRICPFEAVAECRSGDSLGNCSKNCWHVLNELLDDYDKQIRADVISEFAEWLEMMDYLNRIDIDYGWDEQSYQSICGLTKDEVIEEFNEYVNDKKNEHDAIEKMDDVISKLYDMLQSADELGLKEVTISTEDLAHLISMVKRGE